MRLAVVAIARDTFDVAHAIEIAATARTVADGLAGIETVGDPSLMILGSDELDSVMEVLVSEGPVDGLLVLQASFADSTAVERLAGLIAGPVTLWGFPETRTGGRLRLNSLCGLNLAAYALGDRQDVRHLYLDPGATDAGSRLAQVLFADPKTRAEITVAPRPAGASRAQAAKELLSRTLVGVIGDHPIGFGPCAYEDSILDSVLGVKTDAIPLETLFDSAAAAPIEDVSQVTDSLSGRLDRIETLDKTGLDKSIRLAIGLGQLVDERKWDAVATRCWPECFTEFGGAMCAPNGLVTNERGVPGLCEADVYGAVTAVMLQSLASQPVFVADLVHLDPGDQTAVFWHCGNAPASMAAVGSRPVATVHPNRRLPLLLEFPLRPGVVTIARFSQSRGVHRLVIGGAEMLARPLAFSGTAGVARLDRSVDETLSTMVGEGLDHHYGIVYGDVREDLRDLAGLMDLPIVEF